MSFRDVLRSMTPQFLLDWNRRRVKANKNKVLEVQKQQGNVLFVGDLQRAFEAAGVKKGADVLVHSSLSKIGYVEGGPATVVQALLNAIGSEGTLLMPSSPVKVLQADHVKQEEPFNVQETPSAMGAITEVFRNWPGTLRSSHPLEPVCANGPRAMEYISGHHLDRSSYGQRSPWLKHMEHDGLILYIGTTLINSGTSLHAVEDVIGYEEFPYEIYLPGMANPTVIDKGRSFTVTTKVHNPVWSAKRKCDGLIPLLEEHGALSHEKIGAAPTLAVRAKGMKDVLLDLYYKQGVTMYTPEGTK